MIVVFAVALIPIIAFTGLAIDYGRGHIVKNKLVSAVDSAALAGGRVAHDTAKIADVIQDYFDANFVTSDTGVTVSAPTHSLSSDGKVLTVSATANVATTFLGILGIESIPISATADVTMASQPLDLVLSFDVSGSMDSSSGSGNTRIQAAKNAATDLVDLLFGSEATLSDTFVGVVPWSAMVNITEPGSFYTGATPTPVGEFVNPITGENQDQIFYANNTPVPLLFDPPANWKGCVYARYADGYTDSNQGDTEYGPDTFGTLDWPAWEPPGGAPVASSSSSSKKKKKKKSSSSCGKSKKKSSSCTTAGSDDSLCPTSGITPLKNSKSAILTAINGLQTDGWTNMAQGLVWAWRVLMPTEPFTESAPTPSPPPIRAIILLTDGLQTGADKDAYKGVFGTSSAAQSQLDARLRAIADNVKAEGIRIFAIHFVSSDADLITLMQDVASSPTNLHYYYASDGAGLSEIFKTIGGELSLLRLSK